MRILAITYVYPPTVNNGSNSMHYILKDLKRKGHDVRVTNPLLKMAQSYTHEGINISGESSSDHHFHWCDLIITQLYATNNATAYASKYKKPIVHLLHSSERNSYTSVIRGNSPMNYVVYNSQNVKEDLNYSHPSFILNPPVLKDEYYIDMNPNFNNYVTLIGANTNKGVDLFYRIADAMPEYHFLLVCGTENNRIERRVNVEVMANTPNAKDIYRRTRILLMPSKYESWGRTANEAMLNGIPVICSKAKGLQENCGDAGIYVQADDVAGWIEAIKQFDDPFYYDDVANAYKLRYEELNFQQQLNNFESFLFKIVHNEI